jgi:hypothetical protein
VTPANCTMSWMDVVFSEVMWFWSQSFGKMKLESYFSVMMGG